MKRRSAFRGLVAIVLAVYVAGVAIGALAQNIMRDLLSNSDTMGGSTGGAGAAVHEIRFDAEIIHILRNENDAVISYMAERMPNDNWPFRGIYEISQYGYDIAVFDRLGDPIPFSALQIGDVVDIAYDSDNMVLNRIPMAFERGVNSVHVIGDTRSPAVGMRTQTGWPIGIAPDGLQVTDAIAESSQFSMNVNDGTAAATGVTVFYANESSVRAKYSSAYYLQRWEGAAWAEIPHDMRYFDIGVSVFYLDAGEAKEEAINWSREYGRLRAGHYRLIKFMAAADLPGSAPYSMLAAEFDILDY